MTNKYPSLEFVHAINQLNFLLSVHVSQNTDAFHKCLNSVELTDSGAPQ